MIYDTPVLTGRVDDKTIKAIFAGWADDPVWMSEMHPVIELTRACQLRDEIRMRFGVLAQHLVGAPANERRAKAQRWLIDQLISRGWRKKMIETYFNIMLTGRDWEALGGKNAYC